MITCAICGLFAAIAVPFAGFCVCCCRCAGKCGGYPEHFDKRGDACRRVSLGILLSVFVVAAMFGVVSAFVTNQVYSLVQHRFNGRILLVGGGIILKSPPVLQSCY